MAITFSAPTPADKADTEDLPAHVGGPIAKVYNLLSADQKKEVDEILKASEKDTKGEFKKKMEAFNGKLDKKAKDVLEADKSDFEKFKTDIKEKGKKLGKEGKELFDALKKNFENQGETFDQEHDNLVKLIKGAPKAAIDQFKEVGIPLPPVDEKN